MFGCGNVPKPRRSRTPAALSTTGAPPSDASDGSHGRCSTPGTRVCWKRELSDRQDCLHNSRSHQRADQSRAREFARAKAQPGQYEQRQMPGRSRAQGWVERRHSAQQGNGGQQRQPVRQPPNAAVKWRWLTHGQHTQRRQAHVRRVDSHLAKDGRDVADAWVDEVQVPPHGRKPHGRTGNRRRPRVIGRAKDHGHMRYVQVVQCRCVTLACHPRCASRVVGEAD